MNRANGIDNREVDPDSVNEFKSIGNSRTLREDTTEMPVITTTFDYLAGRVEERLQRRELKGMTVQLMIRYADRQTVTRSRKLNYFIDEKSAILTIIDELFKEHWTSEPVRLLGITVQDLLEKSEIIEQLSLFTYEAEERRASMTKAVQLMEEKYGADVFIQPKERNNDHIETNEKMYRTSFQKIS